MHFIHLVVHQAVGSSWGQEESVPSLMDSVYAINSPVRVVTTVPADQSGMCLLKRGHTGTVSVVLGGYNRM